MTRPMPFFAVRSGQILASSFDRKAVEAACRLLGASLESGWWFTEDAR